MSPARAALLLVLASTVGCSRGGPPATAKATPSPTADPTRPLPSPLPQIVARVNGRAISLGQVLPLAKAALDRVSLAERDKRLPELLRRTVEQYVERELLLEEALARGITADTKTVDWSYDQARREHPAEAEWQAFLRKEGLDPQALRAELRVQHTVAALVERELQRLQVSEEELRAVYVANPTRFRAPGAQSSSFESMRAEVDRAVRRARSPQVTAALVARLRAKARIELLL